MTRPIYSEQQLIASNENLEEKDYWLKNLSGEWIKSSFPCDCEKTREYRTCQMETITFKFTESLNSMIKKVTGGNDYTLHILLVAGLVEVLRRYTDKKDIIVATPIYKQEVDREFINTLLAIRSQLTDRMSFKDLLLQVKETIRGAVENQNYPVGILAENLNLPVFEDEFPLFDIAVFLENIHNEKYLRQISIPFNLIFSYYRGENQPVEGKVEYNSLLYKKSTIDRIITHLAQLLTNALSDVNLPLSSIEILSEVERRQLLVEFNSTAMEYPRDKTIHELFEEQVKKTPNNTAIIETESTRRITYKELNENANRLARLLRKKGVGADRIVGIMMDNSIEMVTGILGILKAGGAYLPISPGLPQKRILTMLNDSGAIIFLTKDKLVSKFKFIPFQNFEEGRIEKVITRIRPQVTDLDTLQVPDRSLVDYEKYYPFIGQSMVKNSITLQYSRGCMFKCLYCFRIWPDKYTLRSGENLFEEVNMYYKLGVRRFGFTDDLPNFNKKEIGKFYRLVIKNGLKIHMHFPNGIRGDILTPDFIDLIMEAGAVTMDLALETASPRLQKLIRKNVNIDRLRRNVEYIIEKYPHAILGVQIMHGFPTETEEEAKASLEFIKSFRWLPFGYMHILKVYPNTAMARFAMEHGVSEENIIKSMDLGYHELPYTLPFPESFTRQCQSEYLGEFFLVKERLLNVLPNQMSMLTEDEMVQKYNSYLPADIKTFSGLLKYIGISREEIKGEFLPEDYGKVENFNEKVRRHFPGHKSNSNATRLLLLDLSQHFTHESREMYHVVDPPLGLMYLLTHLNKTFGPSLNGKIAKSQVDFDNYDELKELIEDFNPHIIGVRTLTYFKDFFHKAISLVRQWGFVGPIIAGGPYATSSYDTMIQDMNIDLAVLGEGEITTAELMTSIMNNEGKLPDEDVLKHIQGIAFVGKEEKARHAWMNREILLMEHIESILCRESAQNPTPINQSTDMAYVIYTSGSTGIAKGVMIQHRNVVNQLTGLKRKFGLDPSLNYLLLAAFTFDVSVMHMFSALSTGAKLFLITEGIMKDPLKLWQYIYENKINILNIVPAFMKAILENIENKKINFRYLFVGGDVFEPELYEKLTETFAAETIINIYGPTETTINASLYPCNHIARNQRIPIGKPLMNYKAYILNSDLNLVPIGGTGELCISGEGMARGYSNRPELTAEKFIRAVISHPSLVIGSSSTLFPNDQCPMTNDRLYRTGDLARWLPDGNIDFLGRLDHQVKIRGFRIEPKEIEKRFLEMEQIKEAVVVAKEDESGDKYLCAYVTSDKNVMTTELRECLKMELPEYMIPTYIVQIDKMPFTTSHKIDTRVLKEKQLEVIGNYVAPSDEIEMELAGIWAEVLNIDIEQMGVNTNFFDLGGHSLRATILISKIHKKMNVKVPLGELFKAPRIKALAGYIKGKSKDTYMSVRSVEKREYYLQSSAQKRLYIIYRIDRESIAYNLPETFPLPGDLDPGKLEETFKKLVQRHESLRTSFHMIANEPIQKVHNDVEFKIEYYGAEGNAPGAVRFASTIKNFIRPFDLSRAPLLRVGLIRRPSQKGNPSGQCLLMVDMHHIISDGISHEILVKDFMALYDGNRLPRLRIQYKDFALWQKGIQEKEQKPIKKQEEYWLNHFTGEVPVLDLPNDYKRPEMQSFDGNAVIFVFGKQETQRLKELAAAGEVTLYMLMMAILNVFLSKVGSQEDIVVGTGVAGRNHADLQHIIGFFVNTLPTRNYPEKNKTFKEFLQEVKKTTLGAIENQEYPFEDLVENLELPRDTSRNPLFDVMFVFQNIEQYLKSDDIPEGNEEITGETDGFNIITPGFETGMSKFDLTLFGRETGDQLSLSFQYNTKLFKQETIEIFIRHFRDITSAVLQDPGKKLGEIKNINEEKKSRMRFQLNEELKKEVETITSNRKNILQDKLRESFHQFKDHIAIEYQHKRITYGQLGHDSDCIAHRLINHKGIKKGTLTGILIENRLEFITALLGILKAGAVFVALDITYPQKRVEEMIRSSNTKLIITDGDNFNRWASLEAAGNALEFLLLEELLLEEKGLPTAVTPGISYSPEDKIYVYFTSGSTGTPRAILGKNSGLVHFIDWEIDTFAIEKNHRFSQLITPGFDAFLRDIFVPLCSGGVVCIPGSKDNLPDPHELKEWLERSAIHLIHCTPSLFRLFNSLELTKDHLKTLKFILLSGERIEPNGLVSWFNKFHQRIQLVNLWGTSETTLAKTCYLIRESDVNRDRVPVGKPLPGARVIALDENMNICDQLVKGELYIQTPFRTLGYSDSPGLNQERFIQNPFGDSPGDLWHRTGDLGRILPDGNIDVMGRNDRQVKIRGIRVELEEIESVLVKYPGVAEAVVIENNELLCAYITGTGADAPDGLEVKEYLSERLPRYMVPAKLVKVREIPRKPNGKVDYDALPHPLAEEESRFQPPRDQMEEKLTDMWYDILGLGRNVPGVSLGIRNNFFELGGNSLNIIVLISRIHKEFNVKLPVAEIFKNPYIEKQASLIKEARKERYNAVELAEKREYYPLSSAQERLYFLYQMGKESILYNIPQIIRLPEEPDSGKVEEAFIKLIKRHESLRTSFLTVNEVPVQKVHECDEVEFKIERAALSAYKENTGSKMNPSLFILHHFVRPFDFSRVPLLRVVLAESVDNQHLLMVDMHHIISDGVSMEVLARDFAAIYAGNPLPASPLQYKDFARWQEKEKQNLEHQEKFWLRQFEDKIPVLNLPTDFPRPAVLSFEGSIELSEISAADTNILKTIAQEENVTLYMVLLALFNILLSKLSGQEDVVIGTPVAGRRHADLEEIIGIFINTLPLRNYPGGEKTFREFLAEIKERSLDAFENQDYQYEDLVDKISVSRDPSRNPIFDVVFSFQTFDVLPGGKYEKEDGQQEQDSYQKLGRAKFDITFGGVESGDNLVLGFEYKTKLFKKDTIIRFFKYFMNLVSSIPGNQGKQLSEITLLTEKERQQILHDFNDTHTDYPKDKTIHQLFEEQVEKTPGKTAVVYKKSCLTYMELDNKANQLARYLRGRGVKPGNLVGIMINHSLEMIVGIMGILKAGGAYLPINPTLPLNRITSILEDCSVSSLITRKDIHETYSFTLLQNLSAKKIKPFFTVPRPQIRQLDQLPIPDRSLVNYEKYGPYIGLSLVKNSISIQGTRGCPYKCAYCHKVWPKTHVFRPAEHIFAEVKLYYDMGVRRFSFIDDIFNLDRKNSSRFFELVLENGLDIHIFFPNGVRADLLTDDYIDLMVEAGTVEMAFALETACPRLQKLIKKNLNLKKFRHNLEYMINKYPHVMTDLFTMHGFPSETREEAMMTLDFIKSLKWIHFPYIWLLKVYPDTEMEKLALENGVTPEEITVSEDRAFHELPETLPFEKSFTLQYRADFFNNYFLIKERLLHILPYHMSVLSEDELVKKWNAYLPTPIHTINALLQFLGISEEELDVSGCRPFNYRYPSHLYRKMKAHFPQKKADEDALRILLLDVSLFFSEREDVFFDVIEPPLGLMYLLTYLDRHLGGKVKGRAAKARIDFDNFAELKELLDEFKPDVIGIRTLNYYKNFYHKIIAAIRQFGYKGPMIAGGPYATTSCQSILQDKNVDVVVLGEGEVTFCELIQKMIENGGHLPESNVLKTIAGIAFIPAETAIEEKFAPGIVMVDVLDEWATQKPVDNPININRSADLAYVIYTSGSTGKPKGVMVEHKNVARLVKNSNYINLGKEDRLLLTGAFAFDITTFEIWAPLLNGLSLYLVDKDVIVDANQLKKVIPGNRISILHLIPQLFNQIAAQQPGIFEQLKYFLVGGDVVIPEYINRLINRYKELKILHMYGPTENTTFSTFFPVDKNYKTNIPIGKPISNSTVYIVDKYNHSQPIGIAGELCTGGAGLARGYLNRVELTNEKFVSHPFIPGERLYKTGDFALRLPDGNIEFLGRRDNQVKIRGFRIELGEIENLLLTHKDIEECFVTSREMNGENQVVAYYKKKNKIQLWPSLAEYFVYDDLIYQSMVNDESRNEKYANAIKKAVKNKVVLEIGPGGEAILARMCIEAGAKKVYAVEILADAFQKAKEIIKKLELEDKIILIHGDVTGVKLPEKVDYCVSEIVGSIGGSEGAAKIINSARCLLKDPKCMIPTRSLTKIAAITLPESEFDCSFDEIGAHYVEKVFAHIGNKFDLRLSLLSLTAKNLISNSEVFENLDFTTENLLENKRDIYLEINSNSTLNGFIVWLTLYCDGEEIIDTLEKKYIWLPIYFPVFPGGEIVKKGDYIKAKVIRKLSGNGLNPDYTLKGKLYKEQENKTIEFIYHSPHITSEYKGNRFYEKIFAKEELKITKPISPGEFREFLVERVPDYMIPVYFVEIEEIPLTPNGKVDRKALPAPGVKIDKEHISPRNKIEEQMVELWSGILDIKKDVIGINSNFFELGGHSLKATILTAKIHKTLNVKVPLAEIFKTPTVKGLSGYIKEAVKDRYASIEPIEKREYYAVSSAQKRLYILQRLSLESIAYNMPRFIPLSAEPGIGKLEDTIIKLIKTYESLRTSFLMINEVPVQKVHDEAGLNIEYDNAKLEEQSTGDNTPGAVRCASAIKNFIRPFDLSRAPLLRVGLTKLADNLHLLMVDMHHITADALSMEVLSEDFITTYEGKPLPQLRIQYKDFARWHNKEKENLEYQERYWLREFKAEIPVLNLPFDHPRPEIQDFAGHDLPFNIGKTETKALKEIALEEGVTSFMLILAIFNVMLAKISNQHDIIIGTDTSGRNHDDLERIIGMFVNTLPLRNFPTPEKTFKAFLTEVKEKTLQAFDNQDYQFEDLVEQVVVKRDASLNPIFDVTFSFKNIESKEEEAKVPGPETQTSMPDMMPNIEEMMTSKFDLTLNGTETDDEIFFSFQYSTLLFRAETIEQFILHFKEVVHWVIKKPDALIGEIEIISEEQNKELMKALQDEKHRKMNTIEETVHPSSSSSEAEFDF